MLLKDVGTSRVRGKKSKNQLTRKEKTQMKKLAKIMTVLCLGSPLTATSVLAQLITNTIVLDENGTGFYNGVKITGGLAADPSGGVAGLVLLYTLPPGPAPLTI